MRWMRRDDNAPEVKRRSSGISIGFRYLEENLSAALVASRAFFGRSFFCQIGFLPDPFFDRSVEESGTKSGTTEGPGRSGERPLLRVDLLSSISPGGRLQNRTAQL